MSELTDQQIFDRLGAIKGLPTCSQWAAGLRDSIRDQIKRGRTLSERQRATCNKILKENSKEAQKSLANWESEYNMHHKKKAKKQIATYYSVQSGGYFRDLVRVISLTKCPRVASTSKCVTTSTQKRFLPRLSASLVSALMITSSQTQVSGWLLL